MADSKDDPMKVADAAKYSGFTTRWLSRLAEQGVLGRKIAGYYTFTKRELDAYKAQETSRGPRRKKQ